MADVEVREAEAADAGAVLEHVRTSLEEPDNALTTEPDEFTYTVEEERGFLEQYAADDGKVFLVAHRGGELAGVCHLIAGAMAANRHRAELGITVSARQRRTGVGRALMEEARRWAEASPYVTCIALRVQERNVPAIRLYQVFGFETEAVCKGAMRKEAGLLDARLMSLCLASKPPVPYEVDVPPYVPAPEAPPAAPCDVRDATLDDVEPMCALWARIREDSTLLIPSAGFPRIRDVDAYRKKVAAITERENCHLLLATSNGEPVGTLEAGGGRRRATRHEAMVAMGVADGWRGRGVGTRLMEALDERARAAGILSRLMIYVYVENEPAIRLYHASGYLLEGRRINAWFQHGRYYDDLVMAKLLP